jgi:Protein of unknown function (DUF2752)
MSKRLKTGGKGKLAFYILFPIVFFLIPTSWLEKHPPICLYSAVFGVRCPGCGMSRAMSCAVHGNLKKALHYNKLVVIVLPLLAYEWWQEVADALSVLLLWRNA